MRRVLLTVVAAMLCAAGYADDKDEIKKLRQEKQALSVLLKLYAWEVGRDEDLIVRVFNDEDPLTKAELEKFEEKIKKTGAVFARHREAMDTLRQTVRRYGQGAEDPLATKEGVRGLGEAFQRIQMDLDRVIILQHVIKDRESAIGERDAVIDEKDEKIRKLTMARNAVPIAKALDESVPNWKKNAEELKKLRGDLSDRRLTEMIMPLSTFDKDLNGILDKQEGEAVVKALLEAVKLSTEFGRQTFGRSKNATLSDAKKIARDRVFTMIALERLADLDGDGTTTEQEVKLLALSEVLHFNKLAERYAAILASPKKLPYTKVVSSHKDDQTNYKIQSIQSVNSVLIGRSGFTVPTHLYGVGVPEKDSARTKARDYLVTLLNDNAYRIDHKSSAARTARTLRLLEKLSNITITKISFVDTRVSTVFEFLKMQSRNLDPEGEGVSFIPYPQPQPKPKPVKVKKRKEPGLGEERSGFGPDEPEKLFFPDVPEETLEPLVTMDLDNTSLSDVLLAVAQVTGCTIELDGGLVYVRLPDAKPRKKQDTLLQLSLYLPQKGRTVNYLLVRNGLAPCSITEVKSPVEKELVEAQASAKKEKLGIWAK